MEDIKKWLAGERDYNEGVQLYHKYGKNNNLKKYFALKDNGFAKEKVAYELGKLVGVDTTPQGDEPTEGGEPVKTGVDTTPQGDEPTEGGEPVKTGVDTTLQGDEPVKLDKNAIVAKIPNLVNQDYPAELAQMILERAHLVNKKGQLSNSLDTFGADDNDGRAKVMEEMATIRERINEINEAERYWQKNKTMLQAKTVATKKDILSGELPQDKAELLKLQKSLSEKRSKAKSKLTQFGEGSPEGQKLAITIQKINERYEAVEAALKAE
jgi:hypothetical protein